MDRGKKVERSTLIIVSTFMLVLGFAGGSRIDDIKNLIAPVFGMKRVEKLDLSAVEKTYNQLASNFDGKLDQQKLTEGASKGLVEAAGDKYTEYMTAKEAEEFNKSLSGDVGAGIGVELAKDGQSVKVVRVLAKNSAQSAGILPGDIILKVNDEDVSKKSTAEVSSKIRGDAGTTVKISLLRGQDIKEFSVTRAKIENPSVELSKNGDVAILSIYRFDSETGALAKKYAEEIKNEGFSKVILDLRGNGGGYVQAAKTVASLWLEKNALIVSEKTGSKTIEEIRATGNNPLKGMKTVILLDGTSASASEIVAGALKENKAATIVGEKSYGKGSVQTTVDMSGGALLKVTIAKWYTPNGENISNNGISPDVEVKAPESQSYLLNDVQKNKALDLLK
ncbi:MAG: S41 family peptidase [Candidatus Nanogingivalaceae bacterium]|nr:S41 family peptidase [Candidatus Nanogingivalaceae bacterium]